MLLIVISLLLFFLILFNLVYEYLYWKFICIHSKSVFSYLCIFYGIIIIYTYVLVRRVCNRNTSLIWKWFTTSALNYLNYLTYPIMFQLYLIISFLFFSLKHLLPHFAMLNCRLAPRCSVAIERLLNIKNWERTNF